MAKQIRITQTRSIIDRIEPQKRTIKALGLGRPNRSVVKLDTPQIRGMIRKVAHLVSVEDVQ
jgi:large subunit ribosomal protein L30